MLTEICAEIRNYFATDNDRYIGTFRIEDGAFVPPLTLPTDYIRIAGSRLNDGVHRISDNDLVDEGDFHGGVWIMTPPKAFLSLVEDIEAWQAVNGKADSANMSPYTSESFGGYSYTKASGQGGTGTGISWQSAFKSRLAPYRRLLV